MACASCGGGRQLSPNKPTQQQLSLSQSPNRIVVNQGTRSGGSKVVMTPNRGTKRTQV